MVSRGLLGGRYMFAMWLLCSFLMVARWLLYICVRMISGCYVVAMWLLGSC